MQIGVDADACPNATKEILFRAAERAQISLILVANQAIRIPPSRYVKMLRVPGGFDAADRRIASEVQVGDLVVTADIPLAAAVVEKGGYALNPRGELYTQDNIQEFLSLRDFMEGLRGSRIFTGGPPVFSLSDRHTFASQLDRFLPSLDIPKLAWGSWRW